MQSVIHGNSVLADVHAYIQICIYDAWELIWIWFIYSRVLYLGSVHSVNLIIAYYKRLQNAFQNKLHESINFMIGGDIW